MDKKCARCGAIKPRSQFRQMPSGRRYRRCAECHVPRAERMPRAFYKSAEYKRQRRAQLAESSGREFRPSGPGGKGRAAKAKPEPTPEQMALLAWKAWLCVAPSHWLSLYSAGKRAARNASRRIAELATPDHQRSVWRRAKHKRRLRRLDQADGTLQREGFGDLYRRAKRCAYCNCRLTTRRPDGWRGSDATLDHLIAISRGGIHGLVNVAIACASCNFTKRDRDFGEWADSLPADRRAQALRLWHRRYAAPPTQGVLI